jgi:transcriptional regulator with XRE-family HTH domain
MTIASNIRHRGQPVGNRRPSEVQRLWDGSPRKKQVGEVDTAALQQALQQAHKSFHRPLSMTQFLRTVVAVDTDISYSTLHRIYTNKGVPDMGTIYRLAHWMDTPVERFVAQKDGAVAYLPNEPTPQVVDALLFKDKSLSAEAAAHISELFRIAYELAPKKGNGNGGQRS